MKKKLSILCILLFVLIFGITVYAFRNSGADASDAPSDSTTEKKQSDNEKNVMNADQKKIYQNSTYQTEHEFQVIVLIPDITNTITFTLTSEDGVTSTYTTSYDMPSLYGEEKVKLDTKTSSTSEELSDGLYVILGNDSSSMDFMYYYDNAGILRGEVPYSGYVSSVQDLSGHTLVDSGLKGIFTEYDENHQAIATYQMDIEKFIYRVYKYDFNGFYFSSTTWR